MLLIRFSTFDELAQILAVDLGEEELVVQNHYREGLPPWPVLLDTEDRLTAELGIGFGSQPRELLADGSLEFVEPMPFAGRARDAEHGVEVPGALKGRDVLGNAALLD